MQTAPAMDTARPGAAGGDARSYGFLLAGLVASAALALLTAVDIRRGFLFAAYHIRTPFYSPTPSHALMLAAGLAGALACYTMAARRERGMRVNPGWVHATAVALLLLLIADLFTYRGVPAARAIGAGRVGADWLDAFGATGWMRPAAQATSYLLTVCHARRGPAAALLIVLPAISLPCMVLLHGTLRRLTPFVLLSLGVMATGVMAGALFL